MESGQRRKASSQDMHRAKRQRSMAYQTPFNEQTGNFSTATQCFFSTESRFSGLGVTKASEKLRSLSEKLSGVVDSSMKNNDCAEHEEHISHILGKIMMELNRGERLSTFEYIESGIVKALVNYLTNGLYGHRKMNPHGLSHHWDIVQKRFEVFAKFSLSSSTQQWKETPLAILIKILKRALSSLGDFPVILSNSFQPKRSYATIPPRSPKESHCLEVRFTIGEGERSLYHYSAVVEKIWVCTSVGAIASFLWPNVCTSRDRTYSSTDGDSNKLILLLDGRQLNQKLSLYQAILLLRMKTEKTVAPYFWDEVYEITYRRASNLRQSTAQDFLHESRFSIGKDYTLWQNVLCPLIADFPHELKSSRIYEPLILLKILEFMNKYAHQSMSRERRNINLTATALKVPETKFVSKRLTKKLERQMEDPLAFSADSMPSWCGQLTGTFPFLFSFDARCKYFRLITSGVRPEKSFGRKKYIVSRDQIMAAAAEMMDGHANRKEIIEVEYDNEAGSGLGPTIEFYTLVSREFQRVGLGMWRDDSGTLTSREGLQVERCGHVVSPSGLFPRPWSAALSTANRILFSNVIKKFILLGQVVARTLKDGRILDLPLSKSFYKLILDQGLNLYDIQSIDPGLVKVLLEFQGLVDGKKISDSVSGKCATSTSNSYFRKTSIEDLYLDFSLPGYSDYQFPSAHNHKMVSMDNMEEYVSLTMDATVNSGISRQLEAFKSGFSKVLPIKSLQIFTEEELEHLLCGEPDEWDRNKLSDHIKFDHGYTSRSPCSVNLIEILQEFECEQQRAFLLFVTGAPRLPIGGLAALKPNLTVVRKQSSEHGDAELPSVTTCVNYLKLPPYSSKELMREKLLYAMTEGQGSFHLS